MTVRMPGVAKTLCFLSVSFLCVTLGITALRLGKTVQKANDCLDQLHATLTVGYKVTNDLRVTVDNVNKAALDERFYFEKQMPEILGQVHSVLGDTHNLLVSANDATNALTENQNKVTAQTIEVLKTTNSSIAQLDPVLRQSQKNLVALQDATQDLDTLIKSPDVVDTMHNVNVGTASASRTMLDVEHEVHSITHPKLAVSIANWTLKGVHAVGSWLHP